jgi:hypothetical protein
MPSTSPAQKKLMAIAAHTPGGYGGVPQSVGQEFHAADTGKYGHKPEHENKAKIAKALIKRK